MENLSNIFFKLPNQYHQKGGILHILDDCVKILKTIKNNSIDLIFAYPPSNIGKEFEKQKIRKTKNKSKKDLKNKIIDNDIFKRKIYNSYNCI